MKSILNLFSKKINGGEAANDSNVSEREIRNAIRELRSLSSRELNDLGLGRSEIEYAVRHGRRDIDAPKVA